jgi:hypothetical protein
MTAPNDLSVHEYKVGDIVYYTRGEHHRAEMEIEKVYRNGNFILKGSKQQWKPYGWSRSYAKETGQSLWGGATVYPKTPEREAWYAKEDARRLLCGRWAAAIAYLNSRQRWSRPDEDSVTTLETLVDKMKKATEERTS